MSWRLLYGRSWLVAGLLIVFALVGALAGGLSASRQGQTQVELGSGRYNVRVAITDVELAKGLSGTSGLSDDEGMLFVFGRDNTWGIWMKDMRYPIDIIWLDEAKTVVDITKVASPASYPSTTFRPAKLARYVLELAAGSAEKASITVGDQAVFTLKSEKKAV